MKEEADITHLCTDDSPFFTSSLPEVHEVAPGCFLNTNFHMVLRGGVFQTDAFSSMDINEWIALWLFPQQLAQKRNWKEERSAIREECLDLYSRLKWKNMRNTP